jgi:DNA-binding NarL/FixJ family response regulator
VISGRRPPLISEGVVRVAVADDDDHYRFLVDRALAAHTEVALVGEASTAAEMARAVRHADLLLLDWSLPGSLKTLPRLRKLTPGLRVALTSSLPAAHLAPTVAEAGAVGSLAKDVPIGHIPHAIRELASIGNGLERPLRLTRQKLPRSLDSVTEARHVASRALASSCSEETRDAALLLISELVTNGVVHAASEIDVRIGVSARTIRVDITDRSPELPVMRSPELDEVGGRGLGIVAHVAMRWGVDPRRTGKSVWFELPRDTEAAGAP